MSDWDCVNDYDEILQSKWIEEGRVNGSKDAIQKLYNDGYDVGIQTSINYGIEIGFIHGIITQLGQRLISNDNSTTKISSTNNSTCNVTGSTEKLGIETTTDISQQQEEEQQQARQSMTGSLISNVVDTDDTQHINLLDADELINASLSSTNASYHHDAVAAYIGTIRKLQLAIEQFPKPNDIFSTTTTTTTNSSNDNTNGLDKCSSNTQQQQQHPSSLDIEHQIQSIRGRYKLLLIQLQSIIPKSEERHLLSLQYLMNNFTTTTTTNVIQKEDGNNKNRYDDNNNQQQILYLDNDDDATGTGTTNNASNTNCLSSTSSRLNPASKTTKTINHQEGTTHRTRINTIPTIQMEPKNNPQQSLSLDW